MSHTRVIDIITRILQVIIMVHITSPLLLIFRRRGWRPLLRASLASEWSGIVCVITALLLCQKDEYEPLLPPSLAYGSENMKSDRCILISWL